MPSCLSLVLAFVGRFLLLTLPLSTLAQQPTASLSSSSSSSAAAFPTSTPTQNSSLVLINQLQYVPDVVSPSGGYETMFVYYVSGITGEPLYIQCDLLDAATLGLYGSGSVTVPSTAAGSAVVTLFNTGTLPFARYSIECYLAPLSGSSQLPYTAVASATLSPLTVSTGTSLTFINSSLTAQSLPAQVDQSSPVSVSYTTSITNDSAYIQCNLYAEALSDVDGSLYFGFGAAILPSPGSGQITIGVTNQERPLPVNATYLYYCFIVPLAVQIEQGYMAYNYALFTATTVGQAAATTYSSSSSSSSSSRTSPSGGPGLGSSIDLNCSTTYYSPGPSELVNVQPLYNVINLYPSLAVLAFPNTSLPPAQAPTVYVPNIFYGYAVLTLDGSSYGLYPEGQLPFAAGYSGAAGGVAVDPVSRDVFVCAFGYGAVLRFAATNDSLLSGPILFTYTPPDDAGVPYNVYYKADWLYTIDFANNIVVYNATTGSVVTLLHLSIGVQYTSLAAVDDAGYMYILDVAAIVKLDIDGTVVARWNNSDGAHPFTGPAACAIDSQGYVYVADSYMGLIVLSGTNGSEVAFIETAGHMRSVSVDVNDFVYATSEDYQYSGERADTRLLRLC